MKDNPKSLSTRNNNESYWRKVLELWEQSGLIQKAFCDQEQIKLATLGDWRKKFKAQTSKKSPFPSSFASVQRASHYYSASPLKEQTPSGYRLSLLMNDMQAIHTVFQLLGINHA